MKHPKKIAAFASLAAVLPFVTGADAPDVHGLGDPAFWAVVAKLFAAALSSTATMLVGACFAGAGAFLIAAGKSRLARGKAKLTDADPSNDAAGELDSDIGEGLIAFGLRLNPPEKLKLAPAFDESNTPKTGT